MKLEVGHLRKVAGMFFDCLEKRGGSIELNVDYYWIVPRDDRYNMQARPASLECGQLCSDVDDLAEIQCGNLPPEPLMLRTLAAVLLAIAER